ncbi:unnamed protein product [Calypogeia fissa]
MNSLVGQFSPLPMEALLPCSSSSLSTNSFFRGSLRTSGTKPKLRSNHLEILKIQCSRIGGVSAEGSPVAVRARLLSNLDLDSEGQTTREQHLNHLAVEGQVAELTERPEWGFTRRCLLALPLVAATLLASPSLAGVTVENRAPSGNFLLRSFGIGDPDIYYPRFFEGTWNCYSTLIAVETPQGDDKVDLKAVEQSRKRLGYTTTYQARFVPFEGYVVCDRLFTTVSLVESIIGKKTVEHGTWDPRQPNRLELILRGGAKVESTVTKRSAGMFSPYEFESAEFTRQVLDNFSVTDGPPTVKASQNLTRYQWDIAADEVSKIEAIQKVSMYAVPKEGKDFEGMEMFNTTTPITIYKYRITFERLGL